ncbi:uncharacterized protein LOC132550834 [Ylistrum balloti]|uniref:uncharacterized protein LOC132550834 n=1 Tax=Ylistrum balloti TaxID=509963 RepID=UPI00290584FC|nr:uncharacterized protein LOC132550834 [Ylistrum balloti]
MIFLILFVFIGIKLVSCCRKCSKDLEEQHEELTFAKVTSKNWFKVLVFLRMVLFVVCCVLGYYFSYGFGNGDKWADEAVDSWEVHFNGFQQHDINITLPMECHAEFEATITENLAYVENYSLGIQDECLGNLSLDTDGIARLTKLPGFSIKSFTKKRDKFSKYPILVTAVTDHSFPDVMGLIENIKTVLHKAFPKMEAVFFDFGLSVEHHKTIVSNCSFCDVQTYPAKQLQACETGTNDANITSADPQGKRKYESIYKPALIQFVLQTHDFVLWINESIRFNSSATFKKIVKGIKGKSIQLPMSEETIEERGVNENIFALFDEEPCLYQNQKVLDTRLMLIRRNNFTLHAVMRPWVASAFLYRSLPAAEQMRMLDETAEDDKVDSSLLSIILTRLFSTRKQIFLFDFPGMFGGSTADDNTNGSDTAIPNKKFENPVNDITNSDSEIVAIGNELSSKHHNTQVEIEDISSVNNGAIRYH